MDNLIVNNEWSVELLKVLSAEIKYGTTHHVLTRQFLSGDIYDNKKTIRNALIFSCLTSHAGVLKTNLI